MRKRLDVKGERREDGVGGNSVRAGTGRLGGREMREGGMGRGGSEFGSSCWQVNLGRSGHLDRQSDAYHHLGDLTLRVEMSGGEVVKCSSVGPGQVALAR